MAGKRGRTPGFQMGAEHRSKIANSRILSRLIGHAEGTVEMDSTQVQAGLGLLKKVMPDLQPIGDDGSSAVRVVSEDPMSAELWAQQYASGHDEN